MWPTLTVSQEPEFSSLLVGYTWVREAYLMHLDTSAEEVVFPGVGGPLYSVRASVSLRARQNCLGQGGKGISFSCACSDWIKKSAKFQKLKAP